MSDGLFERWTYFNRQSVSLRWRTGTQEAPIIQKFQEIPPSVGCSFFLAPSHQKKWVPSFSLHPFSLSVPWFGTTYWKKNICNPCFSFDQGPHIGKRLSPVIALRWLLLKLFLARFIFRSTIIAYQKGLFYRNWGYEKNEVSSVKDVV